MRHDVGMWARGWSTGVLVALGLALAAPEWVPHALSREDGPVETATFACFAAGAGCALVAALRFRSLGRPAVAAAVLAAVLFVAAGEEVSWGQRLFGVDTPDAFVDGNTQDELNLHNLDGLQNKAIVAQLAVAICGLLLPRLLRQRWAQPAFPFFAAYLAYRVGRVVAVVADWAVADRNSEASELLLAIGLLVLAVQLLRHLSATAGVTERRPRSGPALAGRRR